MVIEENAKAPNFTLEDTDGKTVSLSDFLGKEVIVYFYPKDDTPGCTKQAEGFQGLLPEFEKLNTVILGVSPDAGASHDKFRCKYGLEFPLLCDPEKDVMTAWGAYGEKMLYGKTVIGVIRSTVWIDADGRVKKHWKKVTRAADHPAKVLERLKAI